MILNQKNRKARWFGLALCLLTAGLVEAQQAEVGLRMGVDRRQVRVGEDLTLTLEFKQVGSGNSSVMGEPQISTPEHFEIRGQTSSTQVNMINQQTMAISTTRLRLVATKPGTETLGPALLIYQDASGNKREIKSNVATVTVVEKSGFSLFGKKSQSPPQAPASTAAPPAQSPGGDLRDVKPLLPESHMFIKALLVLILLGLIAGFIWRQLNRPVSGPAVAPLGKAAQLKDAWKKLSNEDLSGKEFCLGLSNLIRECLQYRFQFPAVDFTTEEVLRELKKVRISDDEFVAAEKCLKTCDRVLYADGNLTGRDNLRSFAQALLPKTPKA